MIDSRMCRATVSPETVASTCGARSGRRSHPGDQSTPPSSRRSRVPRTPPGRDRGDDPVGHRRRAAIGSLHLRRPRGKCVVIAVHDPAGRRGRRGRAGRRRPRRPPRRSRRAGRRRPAHRDRRTRRRNPSQADGQSPAYGTHVNALLRGSAVPAYGSCSPASRSMSSTATVIGDPGTTVATACGPVPRSRRPSPGSARPRPR